MLESVCRDYFGLDPENKMERKKQGTIQCYKNLFMFKTCGKSQHNTACERREAVFP